MVRLISHNYTLSCKPLGIRILLYFIVPEFSEILLKDHFTNQVNSNSENVVLSIHLLTKQMILVYFHKKIALMLYLSASLLHDLLPQRNKSFGNEQDPTAEPNLNFIEPT